MSAEFSRYMLVDGHVHFHSCYNLKDFLEGALENFDSGARRAGLRVDQPCYMLFAESAWDHFFNAFWEEPECAPKGWGFSRTNEDFSLIARNGAGREIVLVAGRQIVVQEHLEVLALGTRREFPDGRPLEDVLEAVRKTGALTVLPWGFGKWWFGRRRRVLKCIREKGDSELFLGDTGNRFGYWFEPGLFREARKRGVSILLGTDPFPFERHSRSVGAYGFALDGKFDPERPASALIEQIRSHSDDQTVLGKLATPAAFCRDQIAMQLRPAARA